MAEHWRRGGVNVNRKMRGFGIGNRTMNETIIMRILFYLVSFVIFYGGGAWLFWDWGWYTPSKWDASERFFTLYWVGATIVISELWAGILSKKEQNDE